LSSGGLDPPGEGGEGLDGGSVEGAQADGQQYQGGIYYLAGIFQYFALQNLETDLKNARTSNMDPDDRFEEAMGAFSA
jgi:hypothetical protein